MDVTIVIPVFNQCQYTIQCLESLQRAGVPDTDIVVVDNASTDHTREYLATRPALRVITNAANLGCSAAWNQGVAASKTEWTVLLNNDVVVAAGFREGLIDFARETGCEIVSPGRGEGELDYDFDAFAAAFVQKMAGARYDGVASGVCFMVRRKVFETIGLFDTQLGLAGNEDEDFFRRARQAGFRLGVTGRAYLHHFVSVTQRSVKASLGLPSSARLSASEYYRRKHHLNWARRRWERLQEKSQGSWRRWTQRRRFGMTLKMLRASGAWKC